MVIVKLYNDESIEQALRRFRRKCKSASIFKDLKKSRYYSKPSEKTKIARKSTIKRYNQKR